MQKNIQEEWEIVSIDPKFTRKARFACKHTYELNVREGRDEKRNKQLERRDT